MGSETSVTALKALYQIETFFTSKTGAPGTGSTCCWAASSGRGRLVTMFRSGCSITLLARVLGEYITFLASISGESHGDEPHSCHKDQGSRPSAEAPPSR